jgi:hypothetical protein
MDDKSATEGRECTIRGERPSALLLVSEDSTRQDVYLETILLPTIKQSRVGRMQTQPPLSKTLQPRLSRTRKTL